MEMIKENPITTIIHSLGKQTTRLLRERRAELVNKAREIEDKSPNDNYILWIEGKDSALFFYLDQAGDTKVIVKEIEKATVMDRETCFSIHQDLNQFLSTDHKFMAISGNLRPVFQAITLHAAILKLIELADAHLSNIESKLKIVKEKYGIGDSQPT